jgi:hypothetical protein
MAFLAIATLAQNNVATQRNALFMRIAQGTLTLAIAMPGKATRQNAQSRRLTALATPTTARFAIS